MKINLRRATPADAPALAEVHVAAWHKAYRGLVPDSYLQQFTVQSRTKRFGQFLADYTSETYAAEIDGRIVGFVTLGACRDPDVEPGCTGEIWGIYVSPQLWRKGVGRFLCEQGENLLACRDFTVATLWVLEENSQARSFYKAMGYEPDGASKELRLGTRLPAIRYRKRLAPT